MFKSVNFELLVVAEPGSLPRIVGAFARRNLAVDQLRARRFNDAMHVTICLDAIPEADLAPVEGSLRHIVRMRRVEVMLRGRVRAVA